jgi:excinuclease UvrABC nuclease subunit
VTLFALKYSLERGFRRFTRQEVSALPRNSIGVYAFWLIAGEDEIHECLYVGISESCIRRRLLSHLTNETNVELLRQFRMFSDAVRFTFAFTASEEQTRELEAELIRDWQPTCNIRHR